MPKAEHKKLWGRETVEHDVIIMRKLAQGIIKNGFKFQIVFVMLPFTKMISYRLKQKMK